MADGAQVGYALMGTQDHALLWRGTPQGVVDLHPAGALNSRAQATTGGIHAGFTSFTGWGEAGIWTSADPDSFVNLHQYLGPEWFTSIAYAISIENGQVYVAGGGSDDGRAKALLWIGRLPERNAKAVLIDP